MENFKSTDSGENVRARTLRSSNLESVVDADGDGTGGWTVGNRLDTSRASPLGMHIASSTDEYESIGSVALQVVENLSTEFLRDFKFRVVDIRPAGPSGSSVSHTNCRDIAESMLPTYCITCGHDMDCHMFPGRCFHPDCTKERRACQVEFLYLPRMYDDSK